MVAHRVLTHVHGSVLDGLDIGSRIRSFISANPEGNSTTGGAARCYVDSGCYKIFTIKQGDQHHGKFYGHMFVLVPLLVSKDFYQSS